ncbi:MAG TPA: hypothetical protein VI007_01090 [bacterium]
MIDHRGERGVALITVLLAMVLMLILISAMLAVARNEVTISAFHRDSVRALELAQSALDEGVRRMQGGHTIIPGFTASVGAGTAHVTLQGVGAPGASSSFQEMRAEATVGRATRRLSYLVFTISNMLPPNIVFGYSLATQGSVDVTAGDLYSWTFVKYKRFPLCSSAPLPANCDLISYTYAGWGVRGINPNNTNWCYVRPCASSPGDADEVDKWYPGTRRTMRRGQTIAAVINTSGCSDPALDSCSDTRRNAPIETLLNFACPGGAPGGTVGGIGGWQASDRKQDNSGTILSTQPLYGCDSDNLAYTWVRETFDDDSTASPPGQKSAWFKTVVYEDWFDRYFILDNNPADDGTPTTCCVGAYRKRTSAEQLGGHNLLTEPQYGAVPPFPDFAAMEASLNASELEAANRYLTGGADLRNNSAPGNTLRLGCFASDSDGNGTPDMTCPGNQSDYAVVWLDNGDYWFGGVGLPISTTTCIPPNPGNGGHGTILIDGNLRANSKFEWFGTVFVNGIVERINGNVCIHGGLITRGTVETNGSLTVEGGTSPGSAPLGAVTVVRKAWWER